MTPAAAVRLIILGLLLAPLVGCQRMLMPTPNVYAKGQVASPFEETPEGYRSATIELPYATDRAMETLSNGTRTYGYGRAPSLAWGIGSVQIGKDLTWDGLVEASLRQRRGELPIRVTEQRELGRFPPRPVPVVLNEGRLVPAPEAAEAEAAARDAFQAMIRERLARTERKEVIIGIHGVSNSFESALLRSAELWHFGGRQGVVLCYTWPAGHPGLLEGYHYDYVSSQYTVAHLKQLIGALADMPEVERIHLFAHSRGTDVLMTALRELYLEAYGRGNAVEQLRLGQIVLLAADIDHQVLLQRDTIQALHEMLDGLTIYASDEDTALGASNWVWKSLGRVGQVRYEDVPETDRENIRIAGMIHIIDVDVKWDSLGHSYFESPEVMSDLILLLDGRAPGAEHGRPLEAIGPGFWKLNEGYPELPPAE